MSNNIILSVRLYGQPIGLLTQNNNGKMQFTYDSSATQPLSLLMPIQTASYKEAVCHAFFGSLLPEGSAVRMANGRQLVLIPIMILACFERLGMIALVLFLFMKWMIQFNFLNQ